MIPTKLTISAPMPLKFSPTIGQFLVTLTNSSRNSCLSGKLNNSKSSKRFSAGFTMTEHPEAEQGLFSEASIMENSMEELHLPIGSLSIIDNASSHWELFGHRFCQLMHAIIVCIVSGKSFERSLVLVSTVKLHYGSSFDFVLTTYITFIVFFVSEGGRHQRP